MAGYHQFDAVERAIETTVAASKPERDRHGRGLAYARFGQKLTMAFYAGAVLLHPAMENPTLVVITDRNHLDNQLFGTFARATSYYGRRRCRPATDTTCGSSWKWLPAAWCSPRFRSSCPRKRVNLSLRFRAAEHRGDRR